MLLATLPAAAFALSFVIALRVARKAADSTPLRSALAATTLLWAVWLILGTELLSAFGMIGRLPIAAWWCVGSGIAALLASRSSCRGRSTSGSTPWPRDTACRLLMLLVGLMLGATLAAAIFAAPTTYDCLTYHLPRQVFWTMQGTVEHFTTNNVRQTMMSPAVEFAQLHLTLLAGSDAPVSVLAWCTSALTVSTASMVAAQIGARARGQWLTALCAAAVPQLVMQSTTGKPDLAVALFTLISISALFRLRTAAGIGGTAALGLGLSCGLALLAKGTAMVFLIPILSVVAFDAVRARDPRRIVALCAAATLGLSLNMGHFWRNVQTFDNINGPTSAHDAIEGIHAGIVLNEIHTSAALTSNVARNIALLAATPIEPLNAALSKGIWWLHDVVGIDPNDPRISFQSAQSVFTGVRWGRGESDIGWPVLLLLSALMCAFAICKSRAQAGQTRTIARHCTMLFFIGVLALLLFSLVFRWQIWQARLLLPWAMLLTVPVGVLLGQLRSTPLVFLAVTFIALEGFLAQGLSPRSWLRTGNMLSSDRETQILTAISSQPDKLRHALDHLVAAQPSEVVLLTHRDAPDYVIMRRFIASGAEMPRFRYASPSTPTASLDPNAVIVRSHAGYADPSDLKSRFRIDATPYLFEFPARTTGTQDTSTDSNSPVP